MYRLWNRPLGLLLLSILLLGSASVIFVVIAQEPHIMRDYKGVRLGMKAAEVEATLGKPENKTDTSEEFKIGDDDTLTVHYDGEVVKAIMLYFVDSKNVPAWDQVVGKAEIKEQGNGAKVARVEVSEEKFWVSMYRNKDGSMVTITISR